MRIVAAAGILFSPVPASADGLTDLRSALAQLPATTMVHGSLDVTSTSRSSEDDNPDVGRVMIGFETSDAGLRIIYPRAVLAQADQEARGHVIDPERSTPVRSGLSRVRPLHLAELVDAAAALNVSLQKAQLLQSKASTFHGRPARVLVMKLPSQLSKAATRHVKKLESTLSLWVGEDGIPIGAERTTTAKASFLLLSFQSNQKESWTYARAGDRLVATRYDETQKGEGLGQHATTQLTEVLTLQ